MYEARDWTNDIRSGEWGVVILPVGGDIDLDTVWEADGIRAKHGTAKAMLKHWNEIGKHDADQCDFCEGKNPA